MLKKYKANLISENILSMVYNAIVLPHLEYCSVVWGNYSKLSKTELLALSVESHGTLPALSFSINSTGSPFTQAPT